MCEYSHDYPIWCYQEFAFDLIHKKADVCPCCGEPLSQEAKEKAKELSGFVMAAPVKHKQKTFVYPKSHNYEPVNGVPYIKYSCPVCDLLGNEHQLLEGCNQCALCGVNISWEKEGAK